MSLQLHAAASESLPAGLRARLRRRFAPPTIVLLYHRVAPGVDQDVNQLVTRPENFAAHLEWLAEHTRPVPPADFVRRHARPARHGFTLDGGKPRVLITFDDGYADNHQHALPLLAEHGFSAIAFVTSGQVGSAEPFWWDALEQIVFAGRPATGGWKLPDGTLVPDYPDKSATYNILHAALKPLADSRRRAVLADLADQGGVTPQASGDSRAMNWAEVQAWAAAGMLVGAHTCSHPVLTALATDELRAEIRRSKHDLEEHLGVVIDAFAYPYGARDAYDERCVAAVHAAGFRCAFVNRPGNVRWARSPYALPRCLIRDWPVDEFAARFEEWCRG